MLLVRRFARAMRDCAAACSLQFHNKMADGGVNLTTAAPMEGRRPCRARLSISQLLLGAVRNAWVCGALLEYICSRTKANGHYKGTQTGEARSAVARAEQAKIGLLTFPQAATARIRRQNETIPGRRSSTSMCHI